MINGSRENFSSFESQSEVLASRRAGDPAQIVAASDRARALLKWQPHFDDLKTIVFHALAWERKLLTRASRDQSGYESGAVESL
jgi:UDP-glucose 4-epimerase